MAQAYAPRLLGVKRRSRFRLSCSRPLVRAWTGYASVMPSLGMAEILILCFVFAFIIAAAAGLLWVLVRLSGRNARTQTQHLRLNNPGSARP